MSKNRLFLIVLLSVALPSMVSAIGMGGSMSGMGGMVDKVQLQTEGVGKVEFSHSVHGTDCSACHPKLFSKKGDNRHFTMEQMERGRSCGACHNGRQAFSVEENCAACHAGAIVYRDTGAGDVEFSHTTHAEMLGFSCDTCHPGLFEPKKGANSASMEDMENGESCGACHDGNMAFSVAEDCMACHDM